MKRRSALNPSFLIPLLLLVSGLALADEKPGSSGAMVSGVITGQKNCESVTFQLWLLQGRTVLKQIEVAAGERFEVRAPAGEVTLVAASSSGCTLEQILQLHFGETAQVQLNLSKQDS